MSKKKDGPSYVRASGSGAKNVNQHAPIFYDRRTKRNRDKSSQDRNAIRDSKND